MFMKQLSCIIGRCCTHRTLNKVTINHGKFGVKLTDIGYQECCKCSSVFNEQYEELRSIIGILVAFFGSLLSVVVIVKYSVVGVLFVPLVYLGVKNVFIGTSLLNGRYRK